MDEKKCLVSAFFSCFFHRKTDCRNAKQGVAPHELVNGQAIFAWAIEVGVFLQKCVCGATVAAAFTNGFAGGVEQIE